MSAWTKFRRLAKESARTGEKEITTEPQRILVPVDFSTTSKSALRHASRIALRNGSEIVLLHVIERFGFPAALGSVPREIRKENFKLIRQGETVLSQLASERIDSIIDCHAVVRVGVPYQIIVQVAEELAVDLIVIMTDGYSGLGHVIFGSTAERVVRHALCGVLVLKQ